jgi:hypothetical protein
LARQVPDPLQVSRRSQTVLLWLPHAVPLGTLVQADIERFGWQAWHALAGFFVWLG